MASLWLILLLALSPSIVASALAVRVMLLPRERVVCPDCADELRR
jgi:hypothetical protein